MTDYKWCPKDGFWAVWVLLMAALAFSVFFFSGCTSPEPEVRLITKEEKDQILIKDLRLPPNAKNVVKLDDDWHTFELVIDGRTRKFLRKVYGLTRHGQSQFSTDTITELTPQ